MCQSGHHKFEIFLLDISRTYIFLFVCMSEMAKCVKQHFVNITTVYYFYHIFNNKLNMGLLIQLPRVYNCNAQGTKTNTMFPIPQLDFKGLQQLS